MNIDKNSIIYRRAEIRDAAVLSEYRVKFLNEVFSLETHPDMEQLKNELILNY